MITSSDSVRIYWIYTLLSVLGVALFLVFKPEWFWVMLPPFCTALVKAMRWM